MSSNPLRHSDGSAGDANYGAIGTDYASFRQPEPAIAALINQALGNARTVLNIGAGTGSYEPTDRDVTPVEPSAAMRAQRPSHLAPAIDAVAESLPFPAQKFEAAMGSFTVHQWSNLAAGLAELRRVTQGPIIILTCDPALVQKFWLNDYAPEVLAAEARRYPDFSAIAAGLGGNLQIQPVPIPLHCTDGFNEAYYGRPEMLLNPAARLACSAWSFVNPDVTAAYCEHLRADLATGKWDRHYGHLRQQPCFDGSLRLLIATR